MTCRLRPGKPLNGEVVRVAGDHSSRTIKILHHQGYKP